MAVDAALNYGAGVEDVTARLRRLLPDPAAAKALEILRRDFVEHAAVGPRRVAMFVPLVGIPQQCTVTRANVTALLACFGE